MGDTSLQVVVPALGIVQGVEGLVQRAEPPKAVDGGGDEAAGAGDGMVATELPPHAAAKTLVLDVLRLQLGNGGGVVRDHLADCGVVAVRRDQGRIVDLLRARLREHLVVPDAVLPRAFAGASVGRARAGGVLKRAAVQWHAQHNLVVRDAASHVGLDGRVRTERRRRRVGGGRVDVGGVARGGAPGAGKVVGHQVPEVEVPIHLRHEQLAVVGRPGGHGDREEEAVSADPGSVRIELAARLFEEENEVLRLGVVLRIFPINVYGKSHQYCWHAVSTFPHTDAIEAEILQELNSAGGKSRATLRGGSGAGKVGGIGPAANREQRLELSVSLLEKVELLDAAISVGARRQRLAGLGMV